MEEEGKILDVRPSRVLSDVFWGLERGRNVYLIL